MFLPASQAATLALLIISLLCWGTWANTLKLSGKWRFELYFCDFALGFALLAVVAAFTAGSLASTELTFQENFLVAGYRNVAFVLAAGVVFNVGNMFLTATVSVAGMALAFSVAGAVALIVATVRALIFDSRSGMLLALVGALLLVAAVVLAAYAYSTVLQSRTVAVKQSGKRPPRSRAALPVLLGVAAGIALGSFRPLLDLGRATDGGVAPYGQALLFAASILGSTIVFVPFFFNFPVAGAPIKLSDYLTGTRKQHALGLLGGFLAGAAFLTGVLALSASQNAVGMDFGLREGGSVLAVICGLLLWREFSGSGERPRLLSIIVLILLAGGISVLAIARG